MILAICFPDLVTFDAVISYNAEAAAMIYRNHLPGGAKNFITLLTDVQEPGAGLSLLLFGK